MRSFLLGAVSAIAAFTTAGAALAQDVGETYVWRNVPMGGGGYFVQILPHPTRPNELWVSSDVSGPYVRHSPDEAFANRAYTNPNLCDGGGQGVFGLAIHPDRPDTVFADVTSAGLARSTDGGKTFQIVHDKKAFAKKEGPLVTIDPANPEVIYRGSGKNRRYPGDGRMSVYRSLQGGDPGTFEELFISDQAGEDDGYFVAIPPNSETVNGRSRTVYVGVENVGVYASDDGGETFQLMPQPMPENTRAPGQQVTLADDVGPGANGKLPDAWTPVKPWFRDGLEVREIDGSQTIVPVKNKTLEYAIDLPPDVAKVTLAVEATPVDGLTAGERAHQLAQAYIDFSLPGNGRDSATYKEKILVKPDVNGWTQRTVTREVPAGASRAMIVLSNQAPTGSTAFRNITLTGTTGQPRALLLNPPKLRQLRVASDGTLYVSHSTGVSSYHPQRGWKDISPERAGGSPSSALAVHPKYPNWLISVHAFNLFRSRDGGATWEGPFNNKDGDNLIKGDHAPWFFYPVSAAAAFATFSPHDEQTAYLSDAYMVWKTEDIWADKPVFDAQWRGIENTAMTDLAVPARPNDSDTVLVAVGADIRGVRFTSTTEPPDHTIGRDAQGRSNRDEGMKGGDMSSVATSEADPMRYYGANNVHWEGPSYASRSDDGGDTWRAITNPIPDEKNHGGAKIAVSSSDPDVLVYVPGLELTARYSHDGGETWHEVQGLPWMSNARRNFHYSELVTADKVAPNTFYALSDKRPNPDLYISRDGGKTWSKTGASFPTSRNYNERGLQMDAKPGQAGTLAVSLDADGVWISEDFGKTFRKVEQFVGGDYCALSWGAPAPGTDQATLYVANFVEGDPHRGVYRSTDNGRTWTEISNDTYYSDRLRPMVADRQVFGRVFFGEGGRGVIVGHPRED